MASGQSYGESLPDQVDRISNLFDSHLTLLNDVRELYRDRVALEREYASKLQILVKKAQEKKARSAASLVVGDDPTKSWDEATVRRSTLYSSYNTIVDSMMNTAQDHLTIADSLNSQVVDTLKVVEKKNDDSKKKLAAFFQKLLSERDKTYGERHKSKEKYDEECVEVESYRLKQGRAGNDKHAERAAKALEQQKVDMQNRKNAYILSISVANQWKDKFYKADLPALENLFQTLQTRLTERFVKILSNAQALQGRHYDILKGRLTSVETSLGSVKPSADQDLFIDHNIRPFTAPGEWSFEPCTSHYDTPEVVVEPAPKVVLQNRLLNAQSKHAEVVALIQSNQSEVDQRTRSVQAYSVNHALSDAEDVMDQYLDAQQQLISYTSSETILAAEIEAISGALGGDIGGNRPHSFKSSSFSIPTTCAYCKSSIWGLSKQGKTCKGCGIAVHSKCELKVPADCAASSGTVKSTSYLAPRPSTMSTISSTPTPSSFVKTEETHVDASLMGRVLFDYTATSPFEHSVAEGASVQILEEDDGSGWIKVADSNGKGLVPASYVDLVEGEDEEEETTAKRPPVPSATKPQMGSGQFVRGVYNYQAGGPDELGIKVGGLLELSQGQSGGCNYGDGWWEGYDAQGRKGIFPSNYVELV